MDKATSKLSDTDAPLVARAKGGDLDAFQTLVQSYRKRVYGLVLRMLGNREEAEDVFQEIFLNVFEKLDQFKEKSKFSTWLFSVASNTALMRVRRQLRRRNVSIDDEDFQEEDLRPRHIEPWAENPLDVLERKELQRILEQGISALPQMYRVVFLLRDVEEFSNEEVARMLRISVPATKSRLLRARLFLREYLSRAFAERRPRTFRRRTGQ
jgi:RNA polymerase sigma-70 factor (ECF subfamily)